MTNKIDLNTEIPIADLDLKIDRSPETQAKLAAAFYSPEPPAPAPEKPADSQIATIEDFAKLDLRAGKVVAADRVPKSKKLIRMDVDFGGFKRQILGGIGEHWAPEGDEPGSLVGKTFLFVVNLPPRKMMGLDSHGMILATSYNEDNQDHLTLLVPFNDVPPGSKFG